MNKLTRYDLKYVNPSFPLRNTDRDSEHECFFSYETVYSPLDEKETAESLLNKHFSKTKSEDEKKEKKDL